MARFPRQAVAAAALVTTLSAACIRRLPPAPIPDAVVPAVAAAGLPAGQTGVVVDVVDGPTRVQRVEMAPTQITDDQGRVRYRFVETPRPLCEAPCVVPLPPGNVLLGFPVKGDPRTMETELLHLGPQPSVYRRALSTYDGETGATRVLGILGASFGGAAMMTGAALLPIGLARDNDAMTTAGAISLGASVLLVTFGILAIRADSPVYRPGSSRHFPLR